MDDLIAFLNRMIDEDEASARACAEVYPAPWDVNDRGHTAYVRADEPTFRIVAELEQHDSIHDWLGTRLEHIARHDPARALADVAAKRAIVEAHHPVDPCDAHDAMCHTVPCSTLLALASVYADHPDFKAEWRAA